MTVSLERDGALAAFVLPAGIESGPDSGPGSGRESGAEHVGVRVVEQPTGPALVSPTPDAEVIDRLFASLRAAGRSFAARPVDERVRVLGRAAERMLDPDDPIRREALRRLPGNACLSEAAAREVLDRMAADWTRERLARLVASEFPAGELEPGFVERGQDPDGRSVRRTASPPELALTICSGTVPGVSTTAILRSLLVGAGTLVKPGAGDVVLPTLFAHALRSVDPSAAAALAVAWWPGGDADLEEAAIAAADRIVVYGSDATLRSLRGRTPPSTPLVEYRHRVGLAVVGVDGRAPTELDDLAAEVADAVVPYEQRGCVSPVRVHVVGTREEARAFAERLAEELERREAVTPGRRTPEEASAGQQLRGSLELRRAAGEAIDLWTGSGWTIGLETSGEPFAGGRVVLMGAESSLEDVESALTRWRGRLQAVGVAGFTPDGESRIARAAARAGASRIGPVREMAWPPPWWIHDGRGPLHALVDLVEWVGSE